MAEGFKDSKGKFRPTGFRKTSNLVVQAFLDGEKKKVNNTETDGESLFLFGNKIAQKRPSSISLKKVFQHLLPQGRENRVGMKLQAFDC